MNQNDFIKPLDYLFPSDNPFDIPSLRLDMMGGPVELPFAPYGQGRRTTEAKTVHFYVDDYRFNALWKNPAKLLTGAISSVCEPNFSLFDTTPLAYGLNLIYKKRWIARYLQECGVKIYVDLHVSDKFKNYNSYGVPDGYNAFATRGVRGRMDDLMLEYLYAQNLSQKENPNLLVYGGGDEVHEFCCRHSLVYIPDYMTNRKLKHG